ncbi:MAG: hypothetical protein IPP46_09690 [Bacteroidetes bacterium]|nr:hypothetical protein [Bacteroidota bacterium]
MKTLSRLKLFVLLLLCSVSFIYSGPSALGDWKMLPTDTVRIGDQVWMKKNISIPAPNSFWYERDSVANKEQGRLYFFSSAMAVCPKGWHLPTDEEWQALIDHYGGDSLAGIALMKGGKSGMELTLPGYRSANSASDLFGRKGEQGFYWTSTVKGEQTAYARMFSANSPVITNIYYRRANAFSVRYVKD